jgi:hypothetical protein
MKPSPLMGEGWVGVMLGVGKVLKLAPMGLRARLRRPRQGERGGPPHVNDKKSLINPKSTLDSSHGPRYT